MPPTQSGVGGILYGSGFPKGAGEDAQVKPFPVR